MVAKLIGHLNILVASCMADWAKGIREKTHHSDIDQIVSLSGFAKRMEWKENGRAKRMWCGMFAARHALAAGLARALRPGLWHVKNVEDFFNYCYGKRVPKFAVLDDGARIVLKTFHEQHDAMRRWITSDDIDAMVAEDGPHMVGFADDGLIRGGDILLVDREGDGTPNHITVVKSYTNGIITTVEGNAGGMVCVPGGPAKSVRGDAVTVNDRDLGKTKHRAKIYGIGRFSWLDFEHGEYER